MEYFAKILSICSDLRGDIKSFVHIQVSKSFFWLLEFIESSGYFIDFFCFIQFLDFRNWNTITYLINNFIFDRRKINCWCLFDDLSNLKWFFGVWESEYNQKYYLLFIENCLNQLMLINIILVIFFMILVAIFN